MADSRGETRAIKDIVNKIISKIGTDKTGDERISQEAIRKMWRRAAGNRASKRSQPISLRKGRLVVSVEDSSLLYDLTLRKRDIFEKLSRDLKGKISEIQFRIGEIGGEEKPKTRKN